MSRRSNLLATVSGLLCAAAGSRPYAVLGVQQFVVGAGGAGPYQFTDLGQAPDSAFRNTGDHGVLVLELMNGQCRWSFVTTPGRVLDRGSATCR